MCDCSLASVHIRLARPGDELVIYRFNSGALGLALIDDITRQRERNRGMGLWSRLKRLCEVPYSPCRQDEEMTAVCVPPGTRLLLRDISPMFQRKYGCAEVEEVVCTQISADAYSFRDAVLFWNGALVLLQRLKKGQRVRVLSLSSSEEEELIPSERLFSR